MESGASVAAPITIGVSTTFAPALSSHGSPADEHGCGGSKFIRCSLVVDVNCCSLYSIFYVQTIIQGFWRRRKVEEEHTVIALVSFFKVLALRIIVAVISNFA